MTTSCYSGCGLDSFPKSSARVLSSRAENFSSKEIVFPHFWVGKWNVHGSLVSEMAEWLAHGSNSR